MPGFQVHITVSTAAGIAYAAWGWTQYDLPFGTCALAGGLCSIAGIMPDLDSDSGVPSRETIGFAAAVIPMLIFSRLQVHGLSIEQMVLFGAPMYLLIRFGLGTIFKSANVHRGMFHSIPAAVIAGLIGYLVCDSGVHLVHNYKAIAVGLGYLIHLVLDEIWSVDLSHGTPHLKKSSGTALKFVGDNATSTLMTYCILCLLLMFAANEASQPPTPTAFARRHIDTTLQPTPVPDRTAVAPNKNSSGGWQGPKTTSRRTRMDDPWQ
ncbi:MAG: metal-dependent hydrolase [Planctomycetaceae bacterium]|jgi:hypothetical protein